MLILHKWLTVVHVVLWQLENMQEYVLEVHFLQCYAIYAIYGEVQKTTFIRIVHTCTQDELKRE